MSCATASPMSIVKTWVRPSGMWLHLYGSHAEFPDFLTRAGANLDRALEIADSRLAFHHSRIWVAIASAQPDWSFAPARS